MLLLCVTTGGMVGEVKRSAMTAAPKHGSKDPMTTIRTVLERFARMKSTHWESNSKYDNY